MTTAKGLDWFRATLIDLEWARQWAFRVHIKEDRHRELSPLPYYTHVLPLECGRIDYNVMRPSQKVLVTMTGADLRRYEENDRETLLLLREIIAFPSAQVTRLDFAIDVFDTVNITDVRDAVENGTARTHFRTHGLVETKIGRERTGETLYLGSRQSGNMIRVYDKALQTGIEGQPWVRIELECKGDFAHRLALAMSEFGIAPAGCTAIRRLIDAGVPWFDDAVKSQEDVPIQSLGRKETQHTKWVQTFLIPQAIRAIHDDTCGIRDILREALARVDVN